PSLCRSYACAVSSSDGSIDLSHLEALPRFELRIHSAARERSLRARFTEANGNYHNIANTWLVRGIPSSSPLTPATQSGLCRIGPGCRIVCRRGHQPGSSSQPAAMDGSTSQLVQAMAGFGGGSGATDNLNAAPLSADTSQQPLLTMPLHA